MKLLTLAILLVGGSAWAEVAPIPAGAPVNPFTGVSHQDQSMKIPPVPVPPPAPLPMAADIAEVGLPSDFKTALDQLVLVGRTDKFSVIGTPPPHGMQGAQTGSRVLRTVTVKDGGILHLNGRKVTVDLDPEGTGVFIREPKKGGTVLVYIDVDSLRTVIPTLTPVEGPAYGGVGVGGTVPGMPSPAAFMTGNSPGGNSPNMTGQPR